MYNIVSFVGRHYTHVNYLLMRYHRASQSYKEMDRVIGQRVEIWKGILDGLIHPEEVDI